MQGLIEEASFRDRSYLFPDRTAAGRLLAQKLRDYKGVPRRGVGHSSRRGAGGGGDRPRLCNCLWT